MKKLILIIVVLAILVAGGLAFFFLGKKPLVLLGDWKAASLVPGDTLVFAQFSDFERSRARWRETALYKIAHEPEVMAFLEKPESKVPQNGEVENEIGEAKKIGAKEAFIAVTSLDGNAPKVVAGFDYRGSRQDAEALATEVKTQLKSQYPAGKSDLVKYGLEEIETYEANGTLVASVFKDHWFFISDDLDLLKATLGRLDGKTDGGAVLRDNAAYKAALAKMPAESDAVLYLSQGLMDRFVALVSVSGQGVDPKQLEEIKKVQAITAGMKLDGEQLHDAIYVYKPGSTPQQGLARDTLAYTTPQSLFYFATALNMGGSAPTLPNSAVDATGFLAALQGLQQVLTQAGLSYDDFKQTFGPEFGVVINWPQSAMQPSLLLGLDVKNKDEALKFIDTLTAAGGLPWTKQEIDGVPYYSQPQTAAGFVAITPVMALTDKAVLFGLSLDSVKSAVQSEKNPGSKLTDAPGFATAANPLVKPTGAFGYIDSKGLFEQVYGLGSKTLKMMALFNPHANDYADLSKLPATETISRHLSPIVYSQASTEDGILVESAGPVTFNDVLFAAGVGIAGSKLAAGAHASVYPGNQQVAPAPSPVP